MLLRNFNIGFALEMKLQQSDKSRDSEGFLALFYCGCNLLVVALVYATARKSVHILFFVATKLQYFMGYLKSNLSFNFKKGNK